MTNWNPVKLLGEGSYGAVYLAEPKTEKGHNLVALKSSPLEYSSSLLMEKDALKNFIGCPEIVQYIESELSLIDDSLCYSLVLEYAAGGTLDDLITHRGKLQETEVKNYLTMILRGLSCIHDRQFVHADLKPANILVFPKTDGEIQLKIADFGLSKRCIEYEEMAEYCCNVKPMFRGTPIYMSPESVLFGKINTSLDIWSLGCILIEMVSGKPVWSECKNRKEVMKKLVYEMEIPDIPEELSREGRDFLACCLDQNSDRRWTANMLLQHPFLKQERKVSLSVSVSVDEYSKDFHEDHNLYLTQEKKDGEIQTQDCRIYELAELIGFHDFLL